MSPTPDAHSQDWWAVILFQEDDPAQAPRGVIVKLTLAEAEAERERWQLENNGWFPRVLRVEAHQHP